MIFLLLLTAQTVDLPRPAGWVVEVNEGKIRCLSPDRKILVSIDPIAANGDAPTVLRRLLNLKRVGPVDAPSNVLMKGYASQVFVATEVYSNAAITNRNVASIYGYFAKPEGEAEAREAVGRALAS